MDMLSFQTKFLLDFIFLPSVVFYQWRVVRFMTGEALALESDLHYEPNINGFAIKLAGMNSKFEWNNVGQAQKLDKICYNI